MDQQNQINAMLQCIEELERRIVIWKKDMTSQQETPTETLSQQKDDESLQKSQQPDKIILKFLAVEREDRRKEDEIRHKQSEETLKALKALKALETELERDRALWQSEKKDEQSVEAQKKVRHAEVGKLQHNEVSLKKDLIIEMKKKTGELQTKDALLQDRDKEFKGKTRQLQEAENALQNTETELQETKNALQNMEMELQGTKSALQKTKSALQETKNALQNTKMELQGTKSALQNTETELQETKNALQNTEMELQGTKSALQNTEMELKKTESALKATKTALETSEILIQTKVVDLAVKDRQLQESNSLSQEKDIKLSDQARLLQEKDLLLQFSTICEYLTECHVSNIATIEINAYRRTKLGVTRLTDRYGPTHVNLWEGFLEEQKEIFEKVCETIGPDLREFPRRITVEEIASDIRPIASEKELEMFINTYHQNPR
ncbi:hypothetical protein E4U22_003792 [Claviceps purpurea]|nr:hypothetical protein E4U22_003792 [Claviceps purpurea]